MADSGTRWMGLSKQCRATDARTMVFGLTHYSRAAKRHSVLKGSDSLHLQCCIKHCHIQPGRATHYVPLWPYITSEKQKGRRHIYSEVKDIVKTCLALKSEERIAMAPLRLNQHRYIQVSNKMRHQTYANVLAGLILEQCKAWPLRLDNSFRPLWDPQCQVVWQTVKKLGKHSEQVTRPFNCD